MIATLKRLLAAAIILGGIPALAEDYPRFLVIEEEGTQPVWRSIDDLFEPAPERTVVFEDSFDYLSIEDAWSPTVGARYIDGWDLWRVRHLKGNGDEAYKIHVPGETHEIVDGGLALRALNKSVEEGFPYTAAMISTERSFSFGPGHRIDIEMHVTSLTAGGHFSLWLLEAETKRWPPEIDITELIGSNKHAPDGPVNLISANGLTVDGNGPSITFKNVDPGFHDEAHIYSFIWTDDEMVWLVDGEEIRRQANFVDVPMYFLATWEIGASSNSDFPGPVNESTEWPFEVIIKSVKVVRL